MAVKDGRFRAAARSEGIRSPSEWSKKNAKSSRQLGKKHPLPCFTSMAVKGGKLLEEQLGRRPCARFETPIEQGYNKVQRWAKRLKNVRFATPKQHGTAGQIVPSKGSWSWRRQLLNCLPVKENRPLLMLRCLGRFPPQWQRQGSADSISTWI